MIRATRVIEHAAPNSETVSLDYKARYRRRAVLTSDQGARFLLDLAEATDLRGGQGLALEDGRTIRVVAQPEPLSEINAEGPVLARLAWHVGNRHTPCQIEETRLLIQRDHVLETMLKGLGATVSPIDAPFQPEGGAYGVGRTHGHDHSHDPHADPNAHIAHRHG